ncbi:MAG: diaminopimelate epimerase [Alphaproteobacteria bacterium]|nr:diaminopimelate epimerase [Alphaproteobacteria bacterium]
MTAIDFRKMHGLGNDVVVIDARRHEIAIGHRLARAIADRHRGIGCDQIIRIGPAVDADAYLQFWNADGDEVGACGNGTRCVARILLDETGGNAIVLRTRAGELACTDAGSGSVAVDMGRPDFDWQAVPLARAADTLAVDLGERDLGRAVTLGMGNPHAVFFVPDVTAVDVADIGRRLEHHPMFPERANIGFAQVLDRTSLRLRVWERGAGLTKACGTGACAAFAAAERKGLVERSIRALLDGGELGLEARPDGHVVMTGPAAAAFTGRFDPETLA